MRTSEKREDQAVPGFANDGIHMQGIAHGFQRDSGDYLTVLEDIDLTIAKGEFVSIVGPSGCGKSTLLELVTGLQSVQQGVVTVSGKAPQRGRSDISLMFARDCLLPWRSAWKNVALGLEVRNPRGDHRAAANEWLSEVRLSGFEDALPSELSQGMRQRVALARTFALQSPFLVMDEPFGALDAQTKIVLGDLLMKVWERHADTTVMFVTHDLAEAITLSDRVVVMSRRPGRILADFRVPLERPRHVDELRQSDEFHEISSYLWGLLRQEVADFADTEGAGQ